MIEKRYVIVTGKGRFGNDNIKPVKAFSQGFCPYFFYVFSDRFFYNFWYLCEYINRSVSIISVYRKDVDFL